MSAGRVRLDRWLPAAAGLAAFAVYLRTLYPGLVPIGDSPKFQFVGRIWGTPHNPGYPLYVVLSHYFSFVPAGTLAYRINLMSAVFAAIAVWLLARIVLHLTADAIAAAAAALVFAFGPVFWSQATIAEVYTVAAALLAAAWLRLLVWAERRRVSDLLLAVAIVSLAAGNHLTIVMVCPALVVFVLWTDWRAGLRPRTIAAAAAIVALGLAQYGLIVYWTLRRPAYLESSAVNARQLFDVMRGGQFANRLFNAGWREVLFERTPQLAALLLREAGPFSLLFSAAGLMLLVRRRPPVAALLTLSSAVVWVFVINYDVADPEVFLIPVFMAAAVACGVGLAALASRVRRVTPRAALAAAIPALLLPAAQLGAHYRASDHHNRTFETRLYDAILRELPDRSAIVPGTFATELMLAYKLDGERAAAGRTIVRLPRDTPAVARQYLHDGFALFATADARDELARSGFVFAPVPLWDVPLGDYLAAVPPGLIVAIAGPGLGAALPPGRGPAFPGIGAAENLFSHPRYEYAAVGVSGDSSGAVESFDSHAAGVTIAPHQPIGRKRVEMPAALEARSERGGRILLNRTTVIDNPDGTVVAVIRGDGQVLRRARLGAPPDLRLSFDADDRLLRVTSIRDCLDVGNLGWVDVSRLAAGGRLAARIDNYRPFDSTVTLLVGAASALHPRLATTDGPASPVLTADAVPAALLAEVARRLGQGIPGAPFTSRIMIRLNDRGEYERLGLDFGGAIAFAYVDAVVDLNNPRRATLCSGESM